MAKRLGVAEQAIDQWESGSKNPDWQALRKLATYYQRPVAALLAPEPPSEAEVPPDFRMLPTARRELSPSTLLAIRTARWLQGRAIEMRAEAPPATQFTAKTIQLSQSAETAAAAVRRTLGVELVEQLDWKDTHEAYRRWRESVEDQGVLVFQFPFPREESQGFSLFDPACPVIVVNESDVVEARIFTLFHEYAHLLLRAPGICLPRTTASTSGAAIEPFCNRFAAAVLISDAEVRSWNVSDLSAERLRELARRYRVSKYVVLISLRTRGNLSEEAFVRIYKRWLSQDDARPRPPKRPAGGGASAVKKCNRQRGKAFISLVLESARRGVITTHDAATYLGVKLKDFNKLEP